MRLDPAALGRYGRTVAHLRPEQVAHRLRLRTQRAVLDRWPAPFARRWSRPASASGWPPGFVPVDAVAPPHCGTLDQLEQGTFTFLDETQSLGRPVRWDPAGASQLWLYHQHYWEWAWTLRRADDRDRARRIFGEQLRSWMDSTRLGRWNAWAPYPTSLRAWVLVNVEADLADGAVGPDLVDQLVLHAGFLEHNLELDVGGNHLVKNLKALVGLGLRFDDPGLVDRTLERLRRQITVQVLADGGHFELSPSYHCQVLGDLVDVAGLLDAVGRPPVDELGDAIGRMRAWLGAMLMPDGDVPLFNDCERVGPARIAALGPVAPPPGPLTVLPDSGYVVARPGERIHLVADVGQPCPPDLPAHAQADCLTFELALDGGRVVVDPGTSEYGSGPQRQWERSTRAHNTVAVDDQDQTEVWGSFRAGRRARAVLHAAEVVAGAVEIVASHDGYAHLAGAPVHRRRWLVTPDGVEIEDRVDGAGRHAVRMRLLLAADAVGPVVGPTPANGRVDGRGFTVHVASGDGEPGGPNGAVHLSVGPSHHAVGFGRRRPATAVVHRGEVTLPVRWTTSISLT